MHPYRRLSAAAKFLVVSATCIIGSAPVQAFDLSPRPSYVAEYFNTALGHYFYTPHAGEQRLIDEGAAGQGWVRTGLGFAAWPTLDASRYLGGGAACDVAANPCRPVTRFYGTPGIGPNSHFFTGAAAEIAALEDPASGWTREGVSFYIPLPDAQGHCGPGLVPIYRLYNNRWMHNDSNHRYAANVRARQLVREEGWTEEGVAFCAYGEAAAAVERDEYRIEAGSRIVSNAECRSASSGSCIGLFNMGLGLVSFSGAQTFEAAYTDPFNREAGYDGWGGTILATVNASREIAAANSFIHLPPQGTYLGFHLSSANGLGLPLTAMTPLRKAAIPVRPGEVRHGTEYELQFDFNVGLNKVAAGAGSAAYGASSVEFRDAKSGRKFQFNVLAYGTMPGEGTYIGPDVKTGVPIVGVSFGAANPYARLQGTYLTQSTTAGGPTPTAAYRWRSFSLRINRDEFAALVTAARAVDGTLSANPLDYVVDNFGIVNEVAGNGEIAGWLQPPAMSLVPRS